MINYIHKILTKALILAFSLGFVGCSGGFTIRNLRDGDLLFVVNGNGSNITSVTDGVDGLGIDHVAVFSQGNVIEAIPKYGVVENPLDSFLVKLSDGEFVLVGRVEGLDVETSVTNARKFLGKPYDDIFMPSDSAIYCSELVQKSFVFKGKCGLNMKDKVVGTRSGRADKCAIDEVKEEVKEEVKDEVKDEVKPGDDAKVNTSGIGSKQLVFCTIPMSFHDSTGKVTEFWTKFYAARGLTVPEGEPGSNPGRLSRDPNVNILGKLSCNRSLRQAH